MATHDVFRRAVQRGLAILGGPSSLDGTPCGNVHVARNVETYAGIMDNANDNHMVYATVASIEVQYAPRVGQLLVHPTEGSFRLSRLADDDGFKRRFIVVAVP